MVSSVSPGLDSFKSALWINVQKHKQIWLWRKPFIQCHDFVRIYSVRPLIRHAGKIISVNNDNFAIGQRWIYDSFNMLPTVTNKMFNFLLKRKPSGYSRITQNLPPLAGRWLFGSNNGKLSRLKRGLEVLGLGGFASAINALNGNQKTGKMVRFIHVLTFSDFGLISM